MTSSSLVRLTVDWLVDSPIRVVDMLSLSSVEVDVTSVDRLLSNVVAMVVVVVDMLLGVALSSSENDGYSLQVIDYWDLLSWRRKSSGFTEIFSLSF